MAWQDEMTEVLRVLIDDMDTTSPLYTDDNLLRVLLVSARQVSLEMTFSQSFTIDIVNQAISPDPTNTAGNTRDNSFVNLSSLKAACIIDQGAASLAARQAVSVRDGTSAIDLRGVSAAKLKLLEKGWCAVYEDAKLEYQAGQVRVAGAAIMSPFRIFAGYNDVGYYPSETDSPAWFR